VCNEGEGVWVVVGLRKSVHTIRYVCTYIEVGEGEWEEEGLAS